MSYQKLGTFLLLAFLLVFPKGGIKISSIPLTWGYCFLGLFSLMGIFRKELLVDRDRMRALLSFLPFQCISLFAICQNGVIWNEMGAGLCLSFLVSFFLLPFIFLLCFAKGIDELDDFFFHLFKKGMLFISVYGLFLFIIRQLTEVFLAVPLLTINWGDWGNLATKHICRGTVYKLISTYNNGNIYGVCILMLLPLYCLLETDLRKQWTVKTSLLLTFSRTAWIGLLIYEALHRGIFSEKYRKTSWLQWLAPFFILTGTIFVLTSYYRLNSLLTDPSLGGRVSQFSYFANSGWISNHSFGEFPEMVYAGVVDNFGWLGLLFFLWGIFFPVARFACLYRLDSFQKSVGLGMSLYWVLSLSDGATLLIPTMAFYWFLLSIFFRKEPVCLPAHSI